MEKALKQEKTLLDRFVEEVAEEYVRILTSSFRVHEHLDEMWKRLLRESRLDPDEFLAKLTEKLVKRVAEDPRVPEEFKFMIPDMINSGLQIAFQTAKIQRENR